MDVVQEYGSLGRDLELDPVSHRDPLSKRDSDDDFWYPANWGPS